MHYNSLKISSESFASSAKTLLKKYNADIFTSGEGFVDEDKTFIGINPKEILEIYKDTTKDEIKHFSFSSDTVMGFISYDYGLFLRGIETEKEDGFPYGILKKYEVLIKYCNAEEKVQITADSEEIAEQIISVLLSNNNSFNGHFALKNLQASDTEIEYKDKVRYVLDKIDEGYTYQLNLAMRFQAEFKGEAEDFFFSMLEKRPAPFYVFFRLEDKTILSTSPERFLKVTDGEVFSQPIKGTMKIDGDDYDSKILTENEKESAELSMIVDLIRNDISMNCEYGSVRVENHKSVFRVDNLLQMYSNVKGRLKKDRDCVDLLLDSFPGGSITGCPKKSSMEIIESLENFPREIYCGSFVIIEDEKNMDSSIAIRTGYFDENKFKFYAGSGIVADSKPESEYKETMAKAEKFFDIINNE